MDPGGLQAGITPCHAFVARLDLLPCSMPLWVAPNVNTAPLPSTGRPETGTPGPALPPWLARRGAPPSPLHPPPLRPAGLSTPLLGGPTSSLHELCRPLQDRVNSRTVEGARLRRHVLRGAVIVFITAGAQGMVGHAV